MREKNLRSTDPDGWFQDQLLQTFLNEFSSKEMKRQRDFWRLYLQSKLTTPLENDQEVNDMMDFIIYQLFNELLDL